MPKGEAACGAARKGENEPVATVMLDSSLVDVGRTLYGMEMFAQGLGKKYPDTVKLGFLLQIWTDWQPVPYTTGASPTESAELLTFATVLLIVLCARLNCTCEL